MSPLVPGRPSADDVAVSSTTGAPPEEPQRRRVDEIPALQYAPYVLGAAALHVVAWYFQTHGAVRMFVATPAWLPHVAMLVAMVAVRVFAKHGRDVASVVGILTTLGLIKPTWAATLFGFCVVTWVIARLRLHVAFRVALVVVLYALVHLAREGIAGSDPAVLLRPGPPTMLWDVLLIRGLLYQVEVARLVPADRTLLGYLGAFATIPLVGGQHLIPLTFRRFLGDYGYRDTPTNLRAGLGLLALALVYLWFRANVLTQFSGDVLGALVAAEFRGTATQAFEHFGRLRVLAALVLWFPDRYMLIGGEMFFIIGNLRLLGYNLISGYHYPFLSRSFADFWRRAVMYMREFQLVLFYVPVAKALWHRLDRRTVAGLAATAAIVGHIVLVSMLNNPGLLKPGSWQMFRSTMADLVRFAILGGLTIVSVVRMHGKKPVLTVSWPRRVWQTAFTLTVIGINLSFWELVIRGFSLSRALAVAYFVVGGPVP